CGERGEHVVSIARNEDLAPRVKEEIEPFEPVAEDGDATSGCLEQAPGRAESELRHRSPCHVEREPARTEELRVLAWRHVRVVDEVWGIPLELGIHRAAQHESELGRCQRGLDEELM